MVGLELGGALALVFAASIFFNRSSSSLLQTRSADSAHKWLECWLLISKLS